MPQSLLLPLAILAALGSWGSPVFGVTVGVLAPLGESRAEAVWGFTQRHLSQSLAEPGLVFRAYDIPGLRAAVARAEVDFVIANGGLYVELEAAYGARRIATLQSPQARSPNAALASTVVVRHDRRDITELIHLPGRRVAVVDVGAFGGLQITRRELLRAGHDFNAADLDVVGYPMHNVVRRVLAGEADAGIVRNCVVEDMVRAGQLPAGALRVLRPLTEPDEACARSTPLYPDWAFASLSHAPESLAREVAIALLRMPRDGAGLAWTVPTDYEPVRALFRDLQIGPYERLHEGAVRDFAQRWWFVPALLLLAMLGGAAHTLRTRWLLRRRTRELRDALAERERLEREARERQEQLDHLARLGTLGELSSMLVHELAQPLAAIGNLAQGMRRRIERGRLEAGPLEGAAGDIVHEAAHATAVIERVRNFARRRRSAREPVNLCEVIEEAMAMFRAGLRDAPPVELRPAGVGRTLVVADRLQVEHLMLNLLKNAYDATRDIGGRPARIRVHCEAVSGAVRVRVVDNGVGLAPEAAGRLFEPFFSTKKEGLGLGLALATRVAEAHGGRLWVEPGDGGQGLALCFTLPLAEETADAG